MNAAIIVMTILGCGQGESACEYVRTVDFAFSDQAQCEAASERELMRSASAGYPVVIAVCEPLPAMTAGLPDAGSAPANTVPEPQIVRSRLDDPARPDPLRWTVDATRKALLETKKVFGKGWRVLTGRDRREQEPILLGRFVAENSTGSFEVIPTFRP